MCTTLLTVLIAAALLAVCTAQQAPKPAEPADCDISDPDGLSGCIKQLLINSQSKVRWPWGLDPLTFPDHQHGDLRTWDAILIDLSHYKVDNVSAAFLGKREIAVKAVLRWPEITGALSAELRKCKRFVFELCASASARPHLYLKDTVGVAMTVLKVDSAPGRQLTIRPSDTTVTLQLGSLRVKVNLRGLVGAVNNIIGDPASRIAMELTDSWWKNNSGRVEKKVSEVLENLVEKSISADLEKLFNL